MGNHGEAPVPRFNPGHWMPKAPAARSWIREVFGHILSCFVTCFVMCDFLTCKDVWFALFCHIFCHIFHVSL